MKRNAIKVLPKPIVLATTGSQAFEFCSDLFCLGIGGLRDRKVPQWFLCHEDRLSYLCVQKLYPQDEMYGKPGYSVMDRWSGIGGGGTEALRLVLIPDVSCTALARR